MSLTKVSFTMINGAYANPKDYGARGDGLGTTPADEGVNISTATWNTWPASFNTANYNTKPGQPYGDSAWLASHKPFANTDTWDFIGIQMAIWTGQSVYLPIGEYLVNQSVVYSGTFYGDFVGEHQYLSRIIMKNRNAFPTVGTNWQGGARNTLGKPVMFFYRTGLSGIDIRSVGFSTTIVTGFTGDANDIPANLATSTSCVAGDNVDTLRFQECFFSGTGEIGILLSNVSAASFTNIITEYYVAHIYLDSGSSATIESSVIFNTWRNTDTAKRVAGVMLAGSSCYTTINQTNFWQMWYGAVYSLSATNGFRLMSSIVDNSDGAETDGTGQCLSGTYNWFNVQNCTLLFGNHSYAPIVLPFTYMSSFNDNWVSSGGVQCQWGAAQFIGTAELSISGNSFNVLPTGSPNVNGNIIYSDANFPYNQNCPKVTFNNNTLTGFTTNKVALGGIYLGNNDSTVSGSLAMSSGVTSGTYYSLTAPDTLSTGTYLVEVVWGGTSTPYNVGASGTMRIGLQQSTSNGPAIPVSIVDYTNTSKTLTIVPYGDVTGNAAGIKVATNFNYVGTDSNFSYRFVRMI